MKKPPDENHSRNDQEPKHLVPAKSPSLAFAPLLLGHLLLVRLDAAFNHEYGTMLAKH
jgi:hypothetical protein